MNKTPDKEAFEIVKAIRKNVMHEINAMVDDAIGELERHEAWKLAIPNKVAGGEWDWFFALDAKEQRRLRSRWMSEFGQGPDLIADAWNLEIDAAMTEWVRCTRIVDAGQAIDATLRNSYSVREIARSASRGGCDHNELFPDLGYDLVSLLAPQPTCTDYLAEFDANEREDAEYREVSTQWIDSSMSPELIF
jgi:hypothetical protein